eukprot:GHRR01020084.1.p1 GENE.GHRR01020084.1~~GHRR01020084.1.p1  ORF type:complete len:127 (+),score=7.16 GHRR01020084.1:180-560(+)
MKQKRDREEACATCGHYHDVGYCSMRAHSPLYAVARALLCCSEDNMISLSFLLQYEGGEPCSICGHVMVAAGRGHDSCMPTTIINGFLYLGSYDTASRQELLKAMGITHILNVREKCSHSNIQGLP